MSDTPKTVRDGDHFVVEINGEFHVLFQPKDLPRHYISIASFLVKSRAEQYCGWRFRVFDEARMSA